MNKLVRAAMPGWPKSSLLGRLTPDEQNRLLAIGTRAVFPDRHVIIRQGVMEDHAVLLTKGLAKVVVDTETGHQALLAVRAGGDLVGEMSFLENMPRSATVISCVTTTAQLIPGRLFLAFLARNPGIQYQVTRMLSERLRWADEQRVALAALPSQARVARIIIEIARTYGHQNGSGQWELGVALNNSELASFASVSLSSAEKSLRALREAGALGRRRQVIVTDMTALRRFADPNCRNP
jgi:CRP/FNR family cyclic AMP-dependent transcriptional regulator